MTGTGSRRPVGIANPAIAPVSTSPVIVDRFAWLIALACLLLVWLPMVGSGQDDIWIYVHSAESLVNSGGFRNPNGAPQVVVTSWLMTLLGAPLVWAAADQGLWVWLWWKLFALALYLVGIAALLRLLARRVGIVACAGFALLVALFPSTGHWAWGGMDSGLLLLGAVGFARALESLEVGGMTSSRWWVAAAWGTVFCASRTDAMWGFVLPLLLVPWAPDGQVRRRFAHLSLALAIGVGLVVLATWVWTGRPLPNPAMVKAGVGFESLLDGAYYWGQWLTQSPAHMATASLWPLCIVILMGRSSGRIEWTLPAILAAIALTLDIATLVTGGDWMAHFRFATRTLELKCAAVLFAWTGAFQAPWRPAKSGMLVAVVALAAFATVATGHVSGRRGIVVSTSELPADWAAVLTRGVDALPSINKPLKRDSGAIARYLSGSLFQARLEVARNSRRPLVFASYQAGFFVWSLRHTAGSDPVFIDLAGLMDYRLALPREQERTALGLSSGLLHWSQSFASNSGPVAATRGCTPELVYVLEADQGQRQDMFSAGYAVEWEVPGAVVFAMREPGRMADWSDCEWLRS